MLMADLPEGAIAISYARSEEQPPSGASAIQRWLPAAHPPGEAPKHEGWEDSAVAPEKLGAYLRGIQALWSEFGYSGAWYGHLGRVVCTRETTSTSRVSRDCKLPAPTSKCSIGICAWDLAAPCRVSMATGSPAVNFSRRCSVPS